MIDRGIIEQAYAFFHQKNRVLTGPHSEQQEDDIQVAVCDYADVMDKELFAELARGKEDFLRDSKTFACDLAQAVREMAEMLGSEFGKI